MVARAATATVAEVERPCGGGARLAAWRRVPAGERAGALVRAAAWMRERRLELAALEVRECAKPWPEADADVCEAIDFLEYYARAAIELDAGAPLIQVAGERNELRYAPARRGGGDHSVELPARDPVRDDRRGARDRQRGRAQARRAVARDVGCGSSRRCAPAGSRGPRSRCCRARATSARRSSATRAFRRSRSPARSPSGSRSSARRPRSFRVSSRSSGSSPSSAARTA